MPHRCRECSSAGVAYLGLQTPYLGCCCWPRRWIGPIIILHVYLVHCDAIATPMKNANGGCRMRRQVRFLGVFFPGRFRQHLDEIVDEVLEASFVAVYSQYKSFRRFSIAKLEISS